MNNFRLKSLDGPEQELSIIVGNDGDIHVSIYTTDFRLANENSCLSVRVGMGPNSGDPNGNIEGIKYLKGALRALAMEFKYQNGEISKEEIERYRNTPKVRPFEEKYFE